MRMGLISFLTHFEHIGDDVRALVVYVAVKDESLVEGVVEENVCVSKIT